MKTIGVCTTLNEEDSIRGLVLGLRASGCDEVVIVDAASTDLTCSFASIAGAIVIDAEYRAPLSVCLVQAWKIALERNADAVVQIDAGNSHNPLEVGRFLKALQGADMVIGSRFCKGADYEGGSLMRKWGSRIAAKLCSSAPNTMNLTDWTSGYRAFRSQTLEALVKVEYHATMHGWQIEVLASAIRFGFYVEEIPIVYRAGRSSFDFKAAREAYNVWRGLHYV